MNNLLQNQVGCDLMVWETAPRRRNKNNEIKFVVNSNQSINQSDVIVGLFSRESISCYEITEIIDRRKSSQKGKDYLTVKTNWSNKKPVFQNYKLYTNSTFNNLFNI